MYINILRFTMCLKSVDKIYSNRGNLKIVEFVKENHKKILDVGCGTGGNAQLIKKKFPHAVIDGITISKRESGECLKHMRNLYIIDINTEWPGFTDCKYDLILFSHILEHTVSPKDIIGRFSGLLSECGQILIAVPNFMNWKTRFELLKGRFRYTDEGIFDFTHLRFFTFYTVKELLVDERFKTDKFYSDGHFPLGILRKRIFRKRLCSFIDAAFLKFFPNIFASQFILLLSLKPYNKKEKN
ncbi:MAG: class I SAM-dependent methyltransferase [Candidatus Omnitrophica bacterium]|nr:class I SAM-dependent methyltransferase [Candidatus Omnitrophota bacterium]